MSLFARLCFATMLLLVGCGRTTPNLAPERANELPDQRGDHRSRTRIIPIFQFKYGDGEPVRVHVGEYVQWFNSDSMVHSATGEQFDTGFIRPGETSPPIQFLQSTAEAGVEYECLAHGRMRGRLIVEAKPASDAGHVGSAQHSMVVLGSDPERLILHHISLFNDPHHFYHVTLEARLMDEAARSAYRDYLRDHPNGLVILDPELFVLTELESGSRREMTGTFSGASDAIPELENVHVRVERVIQFRKYDTEEQYPERLKYQLVAAGSELFLLHDVGGAPSFQEAARVEVTPPLAPDQWKSTPIVTIVGKRLQRIAPVTMEAAVISNSTHVLMSPPPRTLRPVPALGNDEMLDAEIGGVPHKVRVVAQIYFDTRILNK